MNISTKLFNELLSKDSTDNCDNEDICLISGEKLLNDHITLPCNHKFNYIPLYNEVKKQKISFLPKSKSYSYLETQRLKAHQIKCPYCRKVIDGILPPNSKSPMIIYVNFPHKLIHNSFLKDQCKYVFKSGKKKNTSCGFQCYGEFCRNHYKRGIALKKKNKNLPYISVAKPSGACHHKILRGKRKGEMCGKKAKWSVNGKCYCKTHAVKYGKFHTKKETVTI